MSDAVQSVTQTSLGKKSHKPMGYGKFAATFVNIDNGDAIRVKDISVKQENETIEELNARIAKTPAEDLFRVQNVSIKIDKNDLPGKPLEIETCEACGEVVMDGKHHLLGGNTYCTSCFVGSYYKIL